MDQFNVGSAYYATFLTIGGVFGAIMAFQLKNFIKWFGLFECLFAGLCIVAGTHSA